MCGNHEREFPIPGIPGNIGLQFPSRKSGMEFSTPIPVPEKGNEILWNFHSRSRSRKLGMELVIPVPVTGNGTSKAGIEKILKVGKKRSFTD